MYLELALEIMKNVKPDVRKLSGMRDVAYDADWLKVASDLDLYYMYRDIALSDADRAAILENKLRYDITVIPPLSMGRELIKTAGHYHPNVGGNGYTYPEVYEVMGGRAHYLLQKSNNGDGISDVVLVEAVKGDVVIIPPNYGHVTINPANEDLIMANWVSMSFSSIYDPYKKRHGAAYYELIGGKLVQNDNYGKLPEVRFLKPTTILKEELSKGEEMYGLVNRMDKLAFLNHPDDHEKLWKAVLSDENRARPPLVNIVS